MSDMELVREYAERSSEQAFAAIVSRHVNLVYSVALRQVRDAHLAEEVTQSVFVILARKAGSISPKTILSGWLCQTARYASAKALRMQHRRLQREQESFMQSTHNPDSDAAWMQIAPLLDSALGDLSRQDHDALVMRYFEGRSFKDAAQALGTTEAGAKMRVTRALEKLRKFFGNRGLTLSAGLIASAIAANSVQAAPLTLATTVTLAAAHGTAVTSSTLTIVETTLKYMAWTKIKTATAIAAVALFGIGTTTLLKQPSAAPPPASGAAVAAKADYSTPDATLKTLITALQKADTAAVAAGCTEEKAAEFNNRNFGKSPEKLKAEAEGMAQAFSQFEITRRQAVSDKEIHLHVKATGKSKNAPPGDRNLIMKMKKVGNDWKFDGEQR